MRKGTIVLVPFPFTDLQGAKVRPALVLANPPKSEDFIAVFISSVPVKGKSPQVISVQPSRSNGLKVMSHIRADKIATLQKTIVVGELGVLASAELKNVDAALKSIFAL